MVHITSTMSVINAKYGVIQLEKNNIMSLRKMLGLHKSPEQLQRRFTMSLVCNLGWTPFSLKLPPHFVFYILLESCATYLSPICVKLGWDLVNEKVIYSHSFHAHHTIQWTINALGAHIWICYVSACFMFGFCFSFFVTCLYMCCGGS